MEAKKVQPGRNRRDGDDDATQVIRKISEAGDGAPPIFLMENKHRTPGEWRAVFMIAAAVTAHVLLGLASPHAASMLAFQWSMVAVAATIGFGLVAVFIEKAEGLRKVVLTCELVCALAMVTLDSLYWVRLVLH